MKKVGKSLVARQTKKGKTSCTSTEVIAYLLCWEANDFSKPVRDFKEFYREKPEVIEILNMIDLVIKVLKSEWKHLWEVLFIWSHAR